MRCYPPERSGGRAMVRVRVRVRERDGVEFYRHCY